MSRQIPLTKGAFAIVDDADYARLTEWRWRLNSKGYAIRSFYVDGKEIILCVHRVIMDAQTGQYVDHIDGNRLNNTRQNLRFVTQQQNLMYRRIFDNNSSGYKGVTVRKNQWHARIGLDDRIIHLGFYEKAETAALAYDAAARVLYAEFALLNLPNTPTPPEITLLVHEMLAKFGLN